MNKTYLIFAMLFCLSAALAMADQIRLSTSSAGPFAEGDTFTITVAYMPEGGHELDQVQFAVRSSSPNDVQFISATPVRLLSQGVSDPDYIITSELSGDDWSYFEASVLNALGCTGDPSCVGTPNEFNDIVTIDAEVVSIPPSSVTLTIESPEAHDFASGTTVMPTVTYLGNVLSFGASSCPDNDGDGFDICAPWEVGGDGNLIDCNDNVANIHPGAREVCNGVDNDCDRAVDGVHDDGTPVCNTVANCGTFRNACEVGESCVNGECVSEASLCGNGVLDGGEQCDRAEFGGDSQCTSIVDISTGEPAFTEGTLACDPDCTFNTDGCTSAQTAALGESCADAECSEGDCINSVCRNVNDLVTDFEEEVRGTGGIFAKLAQIAALLRAFFS